MTNLLPATGFVPSQLSRRSLFALSGGVTLAGLDAYTKKTTNTVKVNTVPHNDFQNNINSYLQGSPDMAFTWFAGYRMRYYAAKGLASPMDDAWATAGANFSDGPVS